MNVHTAAANLERLNLTSQSAVFPSGALCKTLMQLPVVCSLFQETRQISSALLQPGLNVCCIPVGPGWSRVSSRDVGFIKVGYCP